MNFHIKIKRSYSICLISSIGITFLGCPPEYFLQNYSARTLYPDCAIFPADSGSKNILTAGISISKALDSSHFIFADGSYIHFRENLLYPDTLNTFLQFEPINGRMFLGYDFLQYLSSITELKLGIINGQTYYDWAIGFGLRLAGEFIGTHIFGQIGIANIRSDEISIIEFNSTLGERYLKTNNTGNHPEVGFSFTINTIDPTYLRFFLNISSKYYYCEADSVFNSSFWTKAVSIGILKDINLTTFLLGIKISQMSYSSTTCVADPTYLHSSLVFQVTRTFR